jgi:hypothetical protein
MRRPRLDALFRRIVFVTVGGPAALSACGGDDAAVSPSDGGAHDAQAGGLDAARSIDAPTDVSTPGDGDRDGDADADAGASVATEGGVDAASDAAPQFPTCADASVSAPYGSTDAGPDAAQCYYYIDYSCPAIAPMGNDCHLAASDCMAACAPLDAGIFECLYLPTSCAHGTLVGEAGAPITLACSLCPGGRRPAGLVAADPARERGALGAFFARVAHLEAASIVAFERLASELRQHGAPPRLVRAAARSAKDEARHARETARLARRHGAEPAAPSVRRARARSLERLARDNEVEGCVREAFGALVATWQAAYAEGAGVRSVMSRIAADETRHAELSLAISRWAAPRLDRPARDRVARARRRAVEQLAREARTALPDAARRAAGLPNPDQAAALLTALDGALWR